jgi:hypothetical protein
MKLKTYGKSISKGLTIIIVSLGENNIPIKNDPLRVLFYHKYGGGGFMYYSVTPIEPL